MTTAIADPGVPGLATALDVDGFLELLERELPECPGDVEILSGRIFDVQYSPGSQGLVLYRLKVRERGTGRSHRPFLSVRALPADQAPPPPPEAALARYAALGDRGLSTPYLPMPQAGLVAYAFPMDPVLTPLLEAFDPEAMREAFQELWQDRRVRVRRVTARPLGYTPQARAAIAYEVLCEAHGSRVPELRHLVGKIHAYKAASKLFATSWAVWRAARLRVRLAPPVGYVGRLNMSLQERVDGLRLGDLAGTPGFARPVRQTARGVAVLHGLPLRLRSKRSAEKEARTVQRWGGVLAALRPDRAARVERLCRELAAALDRRASVSGPVHGDFHPANVLVDGDADHVTLIDLDQMARGDPLIDVGRFLASLRVSSLRVSGHPSVLEPAADGFLEQYLSRTGEDERRARLFEAACLLTAAATGFRLQREGWRETAAALVEEAERVLERAQAGPPAPARGAQRRDVEDTETPERFEPGAGAAGSRPVRDGRGGRARMTEKPVPAAETLACHPPSQSAVRRLARALASECRGHAALVGRAGPELIPLLCRRGVAASELDLDAAPASPEPPARSGGARAAGADAAASSDAESSGPPDTILIAGALEHLDEPAACTLLRTAWSRLAGAGRLVVCVPNEGCAADPAGAGAPARDAEPAQRFSRRSLRRLLRSFGRPRLVTAQPFRWLVMTVDACERPSRGVLERYRVIADLCRGRVLELGCGPGELSGMIADRGLPVVGVDRNAEKIEEARRRYPAADFVRKDILDVSPEEKRYDSVVLSEVLEHVPEEAGDRMLERAASLAEPGGRLIVSVPNEDCVPHRNHVRELTRCDLERLLQRFGSPVLVADQPFRYLLMYVDLPS